MDVLHVAVVVEPERTAQLLVTLLVPNELLGPFAFILSLAAHGVSEFNSMQVGEFAGLVLVIFLPPFSAQLCDLRIIHIEELSDLELLVALVGVF